MPVQRSAPIDTTGITESARIHIGLNESQDPYTALRIDLASQRSPYELIGYLPQP